MFLYKPFGCFLALGVFLVRVLRPALSGQGEAQGPRVQYGTVCMEELPMYGCTEGAPARTRCNATLSGGRETSPGSR